MKLTFDGDLFPLHEVLIERFAGLPPEHDVEEIDLFDPLLPLFFLFINRNIEFADGHTARGVFQFGVAR